MSQGKRELSLELRNAIVWLERQPGVTNVVQGRYTRAKHHHVPGFTRVSIADAKSVHLRAYDKLGVRDLFVHAPPSPLRDQWVAALASGNVIGPNGSGPSVVRKDVAKAPVGPASTVVSQPRGQVITQNAAQVYDVTPELAAQWLEHNTRNRPLRNSTVMKYASDMKAGLWLVTGDAIAFDRNGSIVNGQHRLWAVLEANVTVPMQAAFNLDPDVVRVLDDHLRRSLPDVAKITRPGTVIGTKHAAIARTMMIGIDRLDRRTANATATRQQQLAFMERHWEAIEFAIREVFKNKTARAVTHASILTPVARAFYTRDKTRLVQFGAVIVSGMPDGAGDKAAIVLRNWLLRLNSTGMRAATDIIYRKAERALEAFLDNEPLTSLYEAPKELFLLPEEQAGTKGAARRKTVQ